MLQTSFIHNELHATNEYILESMYRLRKQVFEDRLGWEVSSQDGKEVDYFDTLNPVYLMHTDSNMEVDGCCRILPTEGPYMLRNIFPQLLRGEALPSEPNILEISRFAVNPQSAQQCAGTNVNTVTMDILQQIYDYAIEHNIKRYVAVTSAAMERVLRLAGIPTQRFGDGKLTRIGKVMSVCIWVDINEQYRRAVYKQLEPERKAA